jgi:hypothetical protein
MKRRFDEAVVERLFGSTDQRDLRVDMLYVVETLAVRDLAVAFVDAAAAPATDGFRQDFMVVRAGPDHVQLIWRKPSTRHCWHREHPKPDDHRKLTECREHIAPYAEDGFARLLHEVVRARFPDEKFRFYV